MKYLHTMVRVLDLDAALDFFTEGLGLVQTRRKDFDAGRFSLVFLATAPGEPLPPREPWASMPSTGEW